jgi:nucleotide-binding universal stress UspA family protein
LREIVVTLEKLTSILAVVPEGGADGVLFEKVCRIARSSGARVELFLTAPSDYFAVAGRCAALKCDLPIGFTMHDSITPLGAAVVQRAGEVHADLLIAPRAQLHLEHCPIPLLLIGKTRWAAEPRFAAAIDVAEPDSERVARGILHVAGFLAQRLTAHLDILYSEREENDEPVRMERAVRLARLVREYHVGVERLQVFTGPPERVLPALVAERHYDVLVVGTVPRHRSLLTELHSISRKLAGSTEGDVLLVQPDAGRDARDSAQSAGQQLAHQA